jgi:long-chain acyl-CoA synthetase
MVPRKGREMETRPWLEHYDEGVPHTLQPYPERTLLDVVSDTARQRPDHPVLLFKGTRLSYGEVEQLSDAFAAALVAQGVKKGDRVALLLPNCPQIVIGQLGAWKAGAIVVPVNPLYTERELEHALVDCGVETALVLTLFYDKVKSLQPRTGLRRVIAANIKEYLPSLLRLLFTLLEEKKGGHRITLQPGDLWLADLLRQYADSPRPNVAVGPQDPALLMLSGGTTGLPKAAMGTHHATLMTGMQIHAWFGPLLVDWEDVVMMNMPLFHIYGNLGVLSTGLVGHNPLAVVPIASDMDDMVATIRKTRPAFLPGVPTLFIALLNRPDVQAGKVSLKSIKLCISGAAPLMAETKRRFEALTDGRLVEGYALSESMMAAVVSPVQGTYKPGAVGLPLPDVEIRIVDADTGQETLPQGEVGEILMRAPQLMVGYWQRPTETANMLRDGWLYTGDLGYLDEAGYLFIVDRKKDVIKPSGFQVWPREVEEVIASHPAVAEVGVAGVPDDYQGEAVKAWVVLREGQQVTADDLRAYCRENMAAYKVPRQVEFRDGLPKTMVGKVLRRALVQEPALEHE